jgi:hypothetical protein
MVIMIKSLSFSEIWFPTSREFAELVYLDFNFVWRFLVPSALLLLPMTLR